MKKSDDLYVNLFTHIEKLFGETPDNQELASILSWMGQQKFPQFKKEEWDIYLSKKPFGFCLHFEDAKMVLHDCAKGKAPRTPIFTGCFYYPEGQEGFKQYSGKLPFGVTWSDTSSTLPKKFKEKATPIVSKPTGALQAHIWSFGDLRLTASYQKNQSSLAHILVALD
jgi:hypothetical protein